MVDKKLLWILYHFTEMKSLNTSQYRRVCNVTNADESLDFGF